MSELFSVASEVHIHPSIHTYIHTYRQTERLHSTKNFVVFGGGEGCMCLRNVNLLLGLTVSHSRRGSTTAPPHGDIWVDEDSPPCLNGMVRN
jgi:hypothetical protein